MGGAPAVPTVAGTGHGDPRRRRPAALLVALVGTVGSCAATAARSVVARRDRRKTAQDEALAGSERRYRMLFDQAAVGIAVIRLDGELVDANAALCRMLGHPAAGLVGTRFTDLTHPADRGPCHDTLRALVAAQTYDARLEERYVHVDGHPIWVAVHLSLVCDDAGQPSHLVSHVVDVTDRHDAALALAEMESRYRSLVASLHEGIMVRGLDGTLLVVNKSAARILGRPLDELVRREDDGGHWPFLDPDDGTALDPERAPTSLALRSGEPLEGVPVGIDHPDATLHVLNLNVHPLRRDGEDGFYAVLVSFTDVTHRREAEAALEHRALYDALTGAANRVLINDRIEHAMTRAARRPGSSVALLFVDLDRFKPINDRHGHACGDLVLQVVARRLVDCMRGEHTVGRLGGDEFCVVVEVQSAHDAELLAATLADVIERPIPVLVGGEAEEVQVGASVGVALATGSTTPEDLISRADTAMYHAKRHRRAGIAS